MSKNISIIDAATCVIIPGIADKAADLRPSPSKIGRWQKAPARVALPGTWVCKEIAYVDALAEMLPKLGGEARTALYRAHSAGRNVTIGVFTPATERDLLLVMGMSGPASETSVAGFRPRTRDSWAAAPVPLSIVAHIPALIELAAGDAPAGVVPRAKHGTSIIEIE